MINKLIMETLAPLNLPIYFITRGENPTPCIVFNYIKTPLTFADDTSDLMEYTVLLNLYIEPNRYIDTTRIVSDLMVQHGFIESIFPTGQFDELLGVFNQPMEFKLFT